MEDKYMQGTPPMVLLPAKNYTFKVSEDNYVIVIPRKGKYSELAPEIFDEEAGEFDIMEKDVLYTPSITKVLFATSKYPDLKFNQFFAPYGIRVEEESVTIVGQIIDMMLIKKEEGEDDGESESGQG